METFLKMQKVAGEYETAWIAYKILTDRLCSDVANLVISFAGVKNLEAKLVEFHPVGPCSVQ